MTIQFFDGRNSGRLWFSLPPGPFTWAVQAAAAAARAGWRRFLQAMHETRRQQAAIELAKHRTLICDPATGLSFAIDPPRDAIPRD